MLGLRFKKWEALLAVVGAAVLVFALTTGLRSNNSNTSNNQQPGQSAPAPVDSGATAAVRLGSAPLGINVAPWDYVDLGPGAAVMQPLLAAAGITQLRYGGGAYAEYYDWRTNTDVSRCPPGDTATSLTSGCGSPTALNFSQFSSQARQIGADSMVTVNYGSGTPSEAASWVATASHTPGEEVALWEVGNEPYGCWEVNNKLGGAPAYYSGYRPAPTGNGSNPTCPQVKQGNATGMRTLATSYAVNARPFLQAMKAASPAAKIGVPWAFGYDVPGSGVPDNTEWNNTVLAADGKYISFVDVHYYPFFFSGSTGGKHPTDQQVLAALQQIPSVDATLRAQLNAYDPSASVVVGETGVSSNETTTVCTPVGALFAAGEVLSWLAVGAQSVDWWDLNSYGNKGVPCTHPDWGLFDSAATTPRPQTPYYGYLLASLLARPGTLLSHIPTSGGGDVLAFQASLPGGKHAMAFININTKDARTIDYQTPADLTGTLNTWTYAAAKQNAADSEIIRGTVPAASIAGKITLPAESMTVLETR